MRIIFLSDAHGNQYAMRIFFEMLPSFEYDKVIFGGDAVGYYYGGDEVIDMLRKNSVCCLLGNHDRMLLDVLDGVITEESLILKYGNSYRDAKSILKSDNIEFLRGLKSRMEISADGLNMVFVHGSVTDPLNGRVYPDAVFDDVTPYRGIDYVFCGHTHHKMEKHAGSTVIINPGSIGQQRDGKGCTFMLFDTVTRRSEIHEVRYDIPALVKEIEEREDSEKMRGRLIEVLYRKPDYRKQ
ncbi:MAG: metallophosphoesterase family protein [Blautia sp.]|nr:metallophosphoesterase family protein [Blautia sp.]